MPAGCQGGAARSVLGPCAPTEGRRRDTARPQREPTERAWQHPPPVLAGLADGNGMWCPQQAEVEASPWHLPPRRAFSAPAAIRRVLAPAAFPGSPSLPGPTERRGQRARAGSGPRAGSSKTLPSLGPAKARTPRPENQLQCQPGSGHPPCGDPALLAAGAPRLGQRHWHHSHTATSPVRSDGHRQLRGAQPALWQSPTAGGEAQTYPTGAQAAPGAAPQPGRAPRSPPEKQRPQPWGQRGPDAGSEGGPAAPAVLGVPISVPIAAPARPRGAPGVSVPPRPDSASYLVRRAARGAAPGGRTAGLGTGRPPARAGRGGG